MMGRVSKVVAVLAAVGMLFSGGGMASAAEGAGAASDGASQCVPDESTIAQCFPDKVLAQAIAYKLQGNKSRTGAVLTSKDVEDTISLSFDPNSSGISGFSGISSVQGLQVFTNLGDLSLQGTGVSDVSPLSKLTNLTHLDLDATGVSDVSPLSNLVNLKWLSLWNTRVSDVSPLSTLVKLTTLDVGNTRVSDVSPLSKLVNLTVLSLQNTQVSDVSPLSNLVKLRTLDLDATGVSDVSPLSNLVKLKYLYLTTTRVSDVSPLSKLTKLRTVVLNGTQVLDLSPLSKMNLSWCGSDSLCSSDSSMAGDVRPSVNLTVNADGSVSLPAPRWTDGSFVAPSSTSPAGGVLDAKRGVVTWRGYDAKASYSYDFDRGGVFSGSVTGVKPAPTPTVYAVSFDSQGGSGVASQRVAAGRRASRPADPERSGFVFAGWYTARSGGSEYDFGKPVTGSLTLYARWVRKAQPAASTVAMFRLYNPNSGEHFYTGNVAERDHLAAVGWKSEGVGWTAPAKSGTPVYRMYNPNAGDHHYTMSKAERDMLVKAGWRSEGVGWYSAENQGRAPLYREYNPNARAGAHNYTLNRAENDMLVRVGWRAEGIAWYAVHA